MRAFTSAARAGIVLAVAYPRRFHPAVAASSARSALATLSVNGFSMKTGLPAAAARSTCGPCWLCGVAKTTASTAGYTRTRATAEGFCAEHRIALANDLDALLADPAMTATGVHSVDLLIRLFGPIDEVYCLSQ
jgi:predicted dehydrogenase